MTSPSALSPSYNVIAANCKLLPPSQNKRSYDFYVSNFDRPSYLFF